MMDSGVAGEVDFGLGKCEEGGFDEEDDSQRPLESEQGGFIYMSFHDVLLRFRSGLVSLRR